MTYFLFLVVSYHNFSLCALLPSANRNTILANFDSRKLCETGFWFMYVNTKIQWTRKLNSHDADQDKNNGPGKYRQHGFKSNSSSRSVFNFLIMNVPLTCCLRTYRQMYWFKAMGHYEKRARICWDSPWV